MSWSNYNGRRTDWRPALTIKSNYKCLQLTIELKTGRVLSNPKRGSEHEFVLFYTINLVNRLCHAKTGTTD